MGTYDALLRPRQGGGRHRAEGGQMVEARAARTNRTSAAAAPSPAPGWGGAPAARTSRAPDEIQELLGSITDRPDLERLFARRVGLDSILKLMGRHVSREQIHELLESQHLEEDLRKLLR